MSRSRVLLSLIAVLALCLVTPTPSSAKSHSRVEYTKICEYLSCGVLVCDPIYKIKQDECMVCRVC